VLINQLIVAEASARFAHEFEFEETFRFPLLVRDDLPWAAAFLAGSAHQRYRKKGGARERTLPDFLVGAHAAVKGYRLLTRDARRYRAYFPDLDIVAPDTHP
jgi:predicted nucleic acid-binding protein